MRNLIQYALLFVCCLGVVQCGQETTSPESSQLSAADASDPVALDALVNPGQFTPVVPGKIEPILPGILSRWEIIFVGFLEPPSGASWFNPFGRILASGVLSCHRPEYHIVRTITTSATIGYSVDEGSDAGISWELFKWALFRQYGLRIGASFVRTDYIDIPPYDCVETKVYVFRAFECRIFDVTWHAIDWSWQKNARVYIWQPVSSYTEVYTCGEFIPDCAPECENMNPYLPRSSTWFCASDDMGEPVWHNLGEQDPELGLVIPECEPLPDSMLVVEPQIQHLPQLQ